MLASPLLLFALIPTQPPTETAHWAFRSPGVSSPPIVAGADDPIDAFIAAKRHAAGLSAAPPADRRTLLRRATFDLIGLPPTPEEIDAFLNDPAPDAFARVLDRLLASPHYGERWGRHWLDVARYADSNGMDENLVHAHAWRYRDYVIRSFNADKPFDLFAREQLAGDLMPDADERVTLDRLIATGFLAIGPKMLAEDDPVKMEMDIIDEQLDTAGRAFLALTIGCARCHDHKFDPLSLGDYYGLAGIFKSTKTMNHFQVAAQWHERPVATQIEHERHAAHRRTIESATARLADFQRRADDSLRTQRWARAAAHRDAAVEWDRRNAALGDLQSRMEGAPPAGTIVLEAEDFVRGNVRKEQTGYGEKIGVIYNAGPLPNLAEYDITLPAAGTYQLELRFAAAESRPVELAIDDVTIRSSGAADVTGSWFPDTQRWSVEGVVRLEAGRHTIRLRRDGPFPHFDKLALVPRALPDGVAVFAPINPDQLAAERHLDAEFLARWIEFLRHPAATPFAVVLKLVRVWSLPQEPEKRYAPDDLAQVKRLREELAQLQRSEPPLPVAMAVTEGTATDLRIHLRGNHLTLGDRAPRRFPTALGEANAPAIGAERSGRREFAEWLTRADHPLFARVIVNRVWHWHFGAGLVRSTDNFGTLGDSPSHPELLDWLAQRFIADGWSLKTLHRRLMLTSTYQMATTWNATAARLDPDNRLRWRFDRRRLDAEAIRDALWVMGGQLDRTMGGSLMHGANRGYVPGYPNGVYDKYDFPRRSVYLPVLRSMGYDVLQAFDFPDPSTPAGERASTTVAPQALFMLNGSLMAQQAQRFADRLQAAGNDDAARVQRAYELAYGRPPRPAETQRALAFLDRVRLAADRASAWLSLARAILAANEFVYVD